MKVCRGRRGIGPLILNLGTRWRWVDLTPCPVILYLWTFSEVWEVVLSLEMVLCKTVCHGIVCWADLQQHCISWNVQHSLTYSPFTVPHTNHSCSVSELPLFVFVPCSYCSLSSKMAHMVTLPDVYLGGAWFKIWLRYLLASLSFLCSSSVSPTICWVGT